MLRIENLKVKVEEKQILNGLSLEIKPGEVHAVMGPNGSGKSTLAYTLAGHPKYKIQETRNKKQENNKKNGGGMWLDGKRIDDKTPDERANLGLFLAMQYPVAVPGLTALSFLWQIYKNRNEKNSESRGNKVSVIEFRKWLEVQVESLGLDKDLLKRGLNDGFSGGEKKKLEILQMIVSNPKYLVLDEIDSGLDIDALKKIAQTVAVVAKKMKIGVLLITHYSRILKYIKADKIHIMRDGRIVESGDKNLVKRIEKVGYEVTK